MFRILEPFHRIAVSILCNQFALFCSKAKEWHWCWHRNLGKKGASDFIFTFFVEKDCFMRFNKTKNSK